MCRPHCSNAYSATGMLTFNYSQNWRATCSAKCNYLDAPPRPCGSHYIFPTHAAFQAKKQDGTPGLLAAYMRSAFTSCSVYVGFVGHQKLPEFDSWHLSRCEPVPCPCLQVPTNAVSSREVYVTAPHLLSRSSCLLYRWMPKLRNKY